MAHQDRWADAEAMFTQMRQARLQRELLFTPRDLLEDALGGIRRIQGIVRYGADRNYLLVDELHHDFLLDNQSDWPREGEIALAYIRFSFAGPMAVSQP